MLKYFITPTCKRLLGRYAYHTFISQVNQVVLTVGPVVLYCAEEWTPNRPPVYPTDKDLEAYANLAGVGERCLGSLHQI